jgi:hypothetical protein
LVTTARDRKRLRTIAQRSARPPPVARRRCSVFSRPAGRTSHAPRGRSNGRSASSGRGPNA